MTIKKSDGGLGNLPNDIDFQTILSFQQEGVAVLDHRLTVRYINPAGAKLLHAAPNDLIGEKFPYAINTDSLTEFEVEKGSEVNLWVQARCMSTNHEGSQSHVILMKDVSERKREEELLREAVDAAETRASELEALKFVADQLNQAALLEDAIQSGLETVLALINAEAAWVLLPEDNGNIRMICSYSRENFLKSERRTLGPGFHCPGLDQILSGELTEPTLLTDTDCMQEAGLSPNLPEKHWYVPLHIEGDPIGSLNLVLEDGSDLSAQDYKLLKTISHQFALAIQRSMPLSALAASTKYGQALNQVSQTLSSALDLPAVLNNILKLSVELVGADCGCLGLLTPNKQTLTFMTNLPENNGRHNLLMDKNILWQVIQSGESVLLESEESIQKNLPKKFGIDAKNMILVPVIAGKQTLGILLLYSTTEENKLNAFDQAIAESLGQQAGIAVQNAQLFFEVQQLTITDPLTGLNNQKSFINQAVREMERTWRYKRPLSILSIVIDDIRAINEKFGRENGDQVMQALGRICTESLRRVDVLGRYAGNNFIIMLPETESAYAVEVADRLRNKVAAYKYESIEGTVTFTISIGVAELLNNEVIDLERFIDRANQALYTAIQQGGNQTLLWESENAIK